MSVATTKPDYLNPVLPTAERVSDLLGRMTLSEKAAQMVCIWNEKADKLLNEEGGFDKQRALEHFGDGNGLGQVGRPGDGRINTGNADYGDQSKQGGATPDKFAELTNEIQRFFLENSRLGIPVLFHDECLHGLVACQATSFAQPIGLAATFNPDLICRLYEMTAREARACGIHQALSPVLDVARDPRWGRVEETFGEDPYLVGEMGLAAVRGFQGDRQVGDSDRVVCTLKHYAAHGQPESGNNCAPVSMSERHLRETFLAPFEKAIRQGGAMSVMASYNEIDGVPSHANRWLLRSVLREEWDFDGTVVSDYYAVRELCDRPGLYGHHIAANDKEAAVSAVRAGVNVELPEPDCYKNLVQLVEEGQLSEEELDDLVAPHLAHKFELGLFDRPFADPDQAVKLVGCDQHRDLAREAAHQVITLLKNDGSVLPLDKEALKTIAVIGPNSDRKLLGGYSGTPNHFVTVLEGIRNAVGDEIEILYAEGCKITNGEGWDVDEVSLADSETDAKLIAEAVALAERADLIVLALGGNEQTSREAWLAEHLGDRTDLDLVGRQSELIEAIDATGKPMVSLLFNGRPLSVVDLAEKTDALLECWYLGQESGAAVADVLFGEVNPSGKLPITMPRSVGHLPAYYNYRPSARRGYLFDEITPLYPFGYGLSYTAFEFDAPKLSKATMPISGQAELSVRVTNRGERSGAEVVQVYIRDQVSSVTRPVKELKAFKRISLEPGESRYVTFSISHQELAFWNIDKQFVVEPGEFDLMVGPNSVDLQSVTLTVTS